jgi:hypothetical protein
MSDTPTPAPTPAPAPAPAAATAPAAAAPAPAPRPPRPESKIRLPYQRSCNEKDEKGKLCAGHLKRYFGEDALRKYGEKAEIYRCEFCRVIYLPAPGYDARSGTLQF